MSGMITTIVNRYREEWDYGMSALNSGIPVHTGKGTLQPDATTDEIESMRQSVFDSLYTTILEHSEGDFVQ